MPIKRRDALLIEYQVCEQEKRAQASTYWTIVGVFISFITAIAGVFIYGILSRSLSLLTNTRWVILGVGIIAIFIIVCLIFWLNRTNYFIEICNHRMRAIEDAFKLNINNILYFLDHPEGKNIPERITKDLAEYKKYKKWYKPNAIVLAIPILILAIFPWAFIVAASLYKPIIDFIFDC